MKLDAKKLDSIKYFFKAYDYRANVTEKGKACAYAFYYDNGKLFGAITEETYNDNKEEIEKAKAEGLAEKEEREIRNSWVTQTLAGSIVYSSSRSWETGITYYKLSAQVPRNIWGKIKRYMEYLTRDDEDEIEGDGFTSPYGWVTRSPDKVEEILREIAEEQATDAQRKMAEKIIREREKAEKREKRIREAEKKRREHNKKMLEKINAFFERYGEYPDPIKESPEEAEKYQQGYEKMRIVDGEKKDDPTYPPNIYGGGRWFVLQQDKYIWDIRNNGADGDDWRMNNVATGGAGAIGIRAKWDDEIAKAIRSLK